MGKDIKYLIIGSALLLSLEAVYFHLIRPRTLAVSTSSPAEISNPSPSPTPAPTLTATPTPVPTHTPKPVPTPTPVPPAQINALIDRFSGQYAVDPNVMRHIAICESGFNPSAVNGSYVGLFQFGPITWKNIRKEIGEDLDANLRYSAEESAQTAAYALSQGKREIFPNCAP